MQRVDDQLIERARATPVAALVLQRIGMELRPSGGELRGLCPFHQEKTPSFYVNEDKNVFHCHGCHAGGDAIDFVMRHSGLEFREAVLDLTGGDAVVVPQANQSSPHQPCPADGELVAPIPEDAPPIPTQLWVNDGGHWVELTVADSWTYRNEAGEPLFHTQRFDTSGGKKIRPLTLWRNSSGGLSWARKAFRTPRPLYGLELLAQQPTAQVLIVEGEKAADAARRMLVATSVSEKVVAITWPNGAKALAQVDLEPLRGRSVVIWPDADESGLDAAEDLAKRLRGLARSVKQFGVPEGVEHGWDAADAEKDDGFDFVAFGKGARVVWTSTALEEASAKAAATPVVPRPSDVPGVTTSLAETGPATVEHFWAHLPSHQYLHVPTGELWPASSVDGYIIDRPIDHDTFKEMKPSAWLDRNQAVHQMTWHPGRPQIVKDEIVSSGGWISKPGMRVFNTYRAPIRQMGNAVDVAPWLDHLKRIYPTDWQHILMWFAHRIQRPGEKINHALVLGGSPGIGKDSLLAPLISGVGAWNVSEVTPTAIMASSFNPWVQCVLARVSELHDLKDGRFAFYEAMKIYIAAPPDTLPVNQKHVKEFRVPNVMGVLFTTNNRTDGLYLPPDDRRHFVAWSHAKKEGFEADYFSRLWGWMESGGDCNVIAYLQQVDMGDFNAKAPPPHTDAFWTIVHANGAPEDAELFNLLNAGMLEVGVTLDDLADRARTAKLLELQEDLCSRKMRRSIAHRLARAGFVNVHNLDATDRLWSVQGRRVAIYASDKLQAAEKLKAARARAALPASPL